MKLGINKNKHGRFMPFWIMLGVLGVLLIGSFITPIRIVLDSAFENIEESAVANGTPELSCTNPNANPLLKATCFSLAGFLVLFIFPVLYSWITGMVNGSKAKGAVFAPRLRQMQAALEE